MVMKELAAVLGALILGVSYLGYEAGAAACIQAGGVSEIDQALAVIWRLVPLVAVCGLVLYLGGLLWLDYVRRTWSNLPSGNLPSEEGITAPSGKVGKP
jgi:hypothetical protein